MKSKRQLKRTPTLRTSNKWLHVVALLDKVMARRASPDTPKTNKTLIDNEAVEALNVAYATTLRYYITTFAGRERDQKVEQMISRLWQKAGTRMRRYEPALAGQLKAINPFWSSDVTWNKETIQKVWAHLNSIRTSTNMLTPVINATHHGSTFSTS
jgi:hypothetical protein